MIKYNIYAGLEGGFGGATFNRTEAFSSREEAEKAAKEEAIKEYEYFGNIFGLMTLKKCYQTYTGSSKEVIYNNYKSFVKNWICYYVVPEKEDV